MPKHSKKRSTIKKRLRKQKQKKLANEAKIKLMQAKQQEKKQSIMTTYVLIMVDQTHDHPSIITYTFSTFEKDQTAMNLISKNVYQDIRQQKEDVTLVTKHDSAEIHNTVNPIVKYAKLQITANLGDPSDQEILDSLKP